MPNRAETTDAPVTRDTRFADGVANYLATARTLCETGQSANADSLLAEAVASFPDNLELLIEHARLAEIRGNWGQALERCERLRATYPGQDWGYIGGIRASESLGDREAVDALLRAGLANGANKVHLLEEYCWSAQRRRDWIEALRRWKRYREECPDRLICYSAGSVPLRELSRFDEAESLVAQGLRRDAADSELLANYAFVASSRKDWEEAIARWRAYVDRFPDHAVGYIHAGIAYRELARFAESDAVILSGLGRFPGDIELSGNFAWNAYHAHDWPEALRRWKDYRDRFPEDPLGHHQTMLVLQELGAFDELQDLSGRETPAASDPAIAQLMLTFEALGHNCEFGLVQRHFGAEPWGLLRFAGAPPLMLIEALKARFEGVGDPGYTTLDVQNGEYMTMDQRYHLLMHTFIPENERNSDAKIRAATKWLRYSRARLLPHLKDKLIADLVEARKVFVHVWDEKSPHDTAFDLFKAVRSYGDNRLLYIRVSDEQHAPGTLREAANGLWVGYIDRLSVDNPSFEIWLKLCRKMAAFSARNR